MEYYLIIHTPGHAWREGESFMHQDLMEHGRYIHGLHRQGILVEGGPFLDDTGGMAIVNVEDREAAERIVENDPAVVSGVFAAELRPWMRVDWPSFD